MEKLIFFPKDIDRTSLRRKWYCWYDSRKYNPRGRIMGQPDATRWNQRKAKGMLNFSFQVKRNWGKHRWDTGRSSIFGKWVDWASTMLSWLCRRFNVWPLFVKLERNEWRLNIPNLRDAMYCQRRTPINDESYIIWCAVHLQKNVIQMMLRVAKNNDFHFLNSYNSPIGKCLKGNRIDIRSSTSSQDVGRFHHLLVWRTHYR